MNVTVSVHGRFHAFQLARELAERDALARLITTYPRSEAVRHGVPGRRVTSAVHYEALRRGWSKLPSPLQRIVDPLPFIHERFERFAAAHIPAETDVFVGWSGACLAALRRAHALGAKAVVERGSTHILHQDQVLRDEYARCGLAPKLAHPSVIERELAEYEEADSIAVPSGFVADTFVARGIPRAKLQQVPYGVDLASFRPGTERDDVFRVLFVGAAGIRKGCHLLLQAFRELALPNAELVLVGRVQDELRPFLERFGGPDVKVLGSRPQPELVQHYGRASVFCLASFEEGLAMVMAQAMACGVPILATHATGAGDLLRHGREGLLFDSGDVEALAEHLAALHADRGACERMGAAARVRVGEGFSWADYGARVSAAYARLLGAASSQPPVGALVTDRGRDRAR